MNFIDTLKLKAKDFYKVRDELGAAKAPVYRITRTWREKVGRGLHTDTQERILPSPRIVILEHRRMVSKHGETTEADILLKGFLQSDFPDESLLNNSSKELEEKFWKIGKRLYVTVTIEKKHLTWDVTIKKTNKTQGKSNVAS